MTDTEKTYIRHALAFLEDNHIDAACAMLEIVLDGTEPDDLMQTNFLAHRHKGGERNALKLLETVTPNVEGVKLIKYYDVYEDKS